MVSSPRIHCCPIALTGHTGWGAQVIRDVIQTAGSLCDHEHFVIPHEEHQDHITRTMCVALKGEVHAQEPLAASSGDAIVLRPMPGINFVQTVTTSNFDAAASMLPLPV